MAESELVLPYNRKCPEAPADLESRYISHQDSNSILSSVIVLTIFDINMPDRAVCLIARQPHVDTLTFTSL